MTKEDLSLSAVLRDYALPTAMGTEAFFIKIVRGLIQHAFHAGVDAGWADKVKAASWDEYQKAPDYDSKLDAELVQPEYKIGGRTMDEVFKAAGLKNLSDLQAVMDAVETALHKREMIMTGDNKGPMMIRVYTGPEPENTYADRPVQDTWTCGQCLAINPEDDLFCGMCGKGLHENDRSSGRSSGRSNPPRR